MLASLRVVARAAGWSLLLGGTLVAAHEGSAATSVAVPLESLVASSEAAAFVTPMTQMSVWEGGRIYTYTDVHVDSTVAGSLPSDDVWVRTMGGEVGRVGQLVEGEAVLTVGRPSLLFLCARAAPQRDDGPARPAPASPEVPAGPYFVTARAQGQFPVVLDKDGGLRVRRSAAVGATMAPHGAAPTLLASDVLHGVKVTDVRDALATTWARTHVP